MTVVRDRKIRTALGTNQIAEFVTVTAWKKIISLIHMTCLSYFTVHLCFVEKQFEDLTSGRGIQVHLFCLTLSLYSASRYFKVLIQEMDVKADMGFLMALLGLFSSDTIDRSQEVTNIIACPVRQFKILEIQHILFLALPTKVASKHLRERRGLQLRREHL